MRPRAAAADPDRKAAAKQLLEMLASY